MPKVWVTEFAQSGEDARGHEVPCPKLPALKTSVIDIASGSDVMATAFLDSTSLIEIEGDVAFHFVCAVQASTPTADTNDQRVAANAVRHFTIQTGNPQGLAIAAVAAA